MINQKWADIICAFLFVFILLALINFFLKPFDKDAQGPLNLPSIGKKEFIDDIDFNPTVKDDLADDSEATIKLNHPSVLSYKSKMEILAERKKYLLESMYYPEYEPSEEVFGQIVDNKPWISLKAAYCYWNSGQRRDKGNAEESIFINNPMALIMLEMPYYSILDNPVCDKNAYLFPKSLIMNNSTDTLTVTYDISTFQKNLKNEDRKKMFYMLNALNARDLGFDWGYIVDSVNVSFNSDTMKLYPYDFKNFIHLGYACGIEGGCNNGSPFQPEFNFSVNSLPATINMKLWHNKPIMTSAPSDWNYNLIFE